MHEDGNPEELSGVKWEIGRGPNLGKIHTYAGEREPREFLYRCENPINPPVIRLASR